MDTRINERLLYSLPLICYIYLFIYFGYFYYPATRGFLDFLINKAISIYMPNTLQRINGFSSIILLV